MTIRTMPHVGSCRRLSSSSQRARERELYGEKRHDASLRHGFVTPQMAEGVILDLAHRLRRLSPSSRDPERFHEEKSEIVHALHLIAREVGR